MNRNFNEIYEEIIGSEAKEIEKIRKERIIFLIVLIISITIFILVAFYLGGSLSIPSKKHFLIVILLVILIIIFFNAFISLNINYKEMFKEKIIRRIVQSYNDKFLYHYKLGIRKSLYDKSQYNRHYDKYYSEDLIKGQILDNIQFQMSQVRISEKSTEIDSDGNLRKTEAVLFDGLYGIVDFGNIKMAQMDVTYDSVLNRFSKNRIEIDSAEFEENYDMMSKDKIQTMQIFTSDIIDEINKFTENTGFEMQIRILKDNIFFRIRCRDAFEPPEFKDALDFSTLYKYFKIIDSPVIIITKIVENIMQIE